MDAPYDIRLAGPDDLDQLKNSIRRTLNNPEGKSQRKKFADAIDRRELLVLTHHERGGADAVEAFIEWHSRVDGAVTIRDAGTVGDEPHSGHVKRLVRELLRMSRPPSAGVKVDADQMVWNRIFHETPGFMLEGQEYSRPKYKNIWTWTTAAEAAAQARTRGVPLRDIRPGARR